MKSTLFSIAVIAAASLFCSGLSSQASPLLRYEFSQTGAVQESTGSASLSLTTHSTLTETPDYIRTLPTGGPSVGTSNVLDFTSGATAPYKPAMTATISAGEEHSFLTSGLGSFTITAWVSNLNAKVDRRRIFFLTGGSTRAIDLFLASGTNGNVISLAVAGSATESPERIATSQQSVYVPNQSAEWYFIAVSYDATTGTVSFYSGAHDDLLNLSTATLLNKSGEVYTMPTNSTSLSIGNSAIGASGNFDGYLSDVRFYGEALNQQSIENIHAIPEASTGVAISLGLVLLGFERIARAGKNVGL